MLTRVVKRAITRLRYNNITDKTSPKAQAALGRMMVYQDKAPAPRANPIAAIAWHRESQENPGLWNRTQRKKRELVPVAPDVPTNFKPNVTVSLTEHNGCRTCHRCIECDYCVCKS